MVQRRSEIRLDPAPEEPGVLFGQVGRVLAAELLGEAAAAQPARSGSVALIPIQKRRPTVVRWWDLRKREIVLRLSRGEPLDTPLRATEATSRPWERWRERAMNGQASGAEPSTTSPEVRATAAVFVTHYSAA